VLPADAAAANPHRARLVCDSDGLLDRLWFERDIERVCPHRKNRTRPPLQDGRKLRRYSRRWMVERMFAWVGNFRRLVVR